MGVQFMQSEGLYSQLLQVGNLPHIGQYDARHSWKHGALAESSRAAAAGVGGGATAGYFKSLLEEEEASISGSHLYNVHHAEDHKPLIMRSAEINAAQQCLPPLDASDSADKSPAVHANASSVPAHTDSPANTVAAMPSSACALQLNSSTTGSPLKRGREACTANEGVNKKDKKGSREEGSGGGKEKSKTKGGGAGGQQTTASGGRKGGSVKPSKPARAALPAEPPKTDYVHVRARRGQATDSHSLAERVRREKISERMRFLQDLVPGCSKITGKALILDEIINYVQSLQNQVEFLAMRLAAVNPKLENTTLSNSTEEEIASPFMEEVQDGIGILPKSLPTQSHAAMDLQYDSLPTFYQGLFDDSSFNPSIASDLSTSTCNDSDLTNMDFCHLT